MGITPSRNDFTTLEGYANQTEETRIEILTKAGLQINEKDKEIGDFLGTSEIFGAFIRGIITKCIEIKTVQLNEEVNIYLENKKYENMKKIEEKSVEMNEIINNMAKKWERKEEYYFGHTTPKDHQIITESGYIDDDDKVRLKKEKTTYNRGWEDSSFASTSSINGTEGDTQEFNNRLE
jgi:hypothetical protein